MKTWVKLYTEINRDPKMAEFTWAQRGIWAALLALTGELDHRNGDGSENGQLDTMENTAWRIRCDSQVLSEAVDLFVLDGMLHVLEGILYMSNYPKRQARPPSARPAATRERKRRQRARESQGKVTTSQSSHEASQGVTPSESESETDTDTESDQSQTQNVTEARRAVAKRTGFRHVSDPDLISPSFSSDSDLTRKRGPPLTDAARIERAIQIRERAERGKLSAREEAQMRQWANEYTPAVLYEATRRTAFKKPENFGGYLRKTLEQIANKRSR